MERSRHKVADEHKHNTRRPGRDAAVQKEVEKQRAVNRNSCNLDGPRPPGGALGMRARRKEVCPGEEIEVEACDKHHRVVGVLLIQNGDAGEGVPREVGAIVAGFDGGEEGW